MYNLFPEIKFQTTRSGGKGGQNVNKVESAVQGFFHIDSSRLLTDEQKEILKFKLSNRVNAEGQLHVKSQEHRTQIANKEEVIEKINALVTRALEKKKPRIATKAGKAAHERRIEGKKRNALLKANRQKLKPGEY